MNQPDLTRLQATLVTSGLQTRDNPTYQVIDQLIKAVRQFQDIIVSDINSINNTVNNINSTGSLSNSFGMFTGLDSEESVDLSFMPSIRGMDGKNGLDAKSSEMIIVENEILEDSFSFPFNKNSIPPVVPAGSDTQIQFNNTGVFGADSDLTFVTDTLTATKIVAPTSVSTPSLISTGAITVTPAAGSNLNITLSTTGDLVVNTTGLYFDSSALTLGINTVPTQANLEVNCNSVSFEAIYINNSTSTTARGAVVFGRGGTQKAVVGIDGTTGGIITGSATGDLSINSTNLAILFSSNNGSNIHCALKGGQFSVAKSVRDPSTLDTSKFIVTIDAVGVSASATNAAGFFTPGGRGVVIRAPNSESSATVTNAPVIFTNTGVGNGLLISGASTPTNQLFLESTGNIGIGTTVPGKLLSIAEKFQVDSNGLIPKYNNVTTVGWGIPAIYGSGRSTAQTAAVASVAAYTVGTSDGSFYVSVNVNVTTSTLHNFTVNCAYTDETNTARTLTLSLSQLTGAFVTAITNATGVGTYEGIPLHIRCKASTSITIATTGTFTTVTYNVEGVIIQHG